MALFDRTLPMEEATRKMRQRHQDWIDYCREENRIYTHFLPGLIPHFARWLRSRRTAEALCAKLTGSVVSSPQTFHESTPSK